MKDLLSKSIGLSEKTNVSLHILRFLGYTLLLKSPYTSNRKTEQLLGITEMLFLRITMEITKGDNLVCLLNVSSQPHSSVNINFDETL